MFNALQEYRLIANSSASTPLWTKTAGSACTRLQLKGFLPHSHFFISTMQISSKDFVLSRWIKELHAYFWYVSIKINDQTVFININSLGKRLKLSTQEIREAKRNNQLKALIESRSCLSYLPEAIHNIYTLDKNNRINFKATNQFSEMNFETILKLSRVLKPYLIDENNHNLLMKEGTIVEASPNENFLMKLEKNKLHLIHYSKRQEIGSGASSTVYKVLNITDGIFQALKQLNISSEASSEEIENLKHTLNNEIHNLKYISKKNKKRYHYFQDPPNSTFKISNPPIICSVGKLYKESLSNWILANHTKTERIIMCKHIISSARAMLRDFSIGLLDIKTDNVLLNENTPVHIDFEGMRKMGDANNDQSTFTALSPLFINESDVHILWKLEDQIQQTHEKKDLEESCRQLDAALEKRILFSIGVLCFEILAKGKPPYNKVRPPRLPEKNEVAKLFQKESEETIDDIISEIINKNFYTNQDDIQEHIHYLTEKGFSDDIIFFIQSEVSKRKISCVLNDSKFNKNLLTEYPKKLISLIQGLVAHNPNERPTIKEAYRFISEIAQDEDKIINDSESIF